MITIALTVAAVALAILVKLYTDITILKAAALFLGLEGTVLLASALSPPQDIEEMPKGLLGAIVWSFTEGRRLAYPTRYNPVFFLRWLGFLGGIISLVIYLNG